MRGDGGSDLSGNCGIERSKLESFWREELLMARVWGPAEGGVIGFPAFLV